SILVSGIGHLGAFIRAGLEMVTTWNTEPHGPNVDRRLSRGCDRSLASFALTDRQTRFLVTVMRHAGVFVGPTVCGVRRHHARTEGPRLHPDAGRPAVRDLDRTRHDRTHEN